MTARDELLERLTAARRRYVEAQREIREIRVELARIEHEVIEVAKDDASLDCGCRPAGTLHDADPGFECHPHWYDRVARARGWTVGRADAPARRYHRDIVV